MTSAAPTRSAVLELKEERVAMQEGYIFLDEKCLLLAGEMLRELAHYSALQQTFMRAWDSAVNALRAAVARHGLQGLQVYPAPDFTAADVRRTPHALMGVRLQEAELVAVAHAAPLAVDRSPEAEACRRAFGHLMQQAAPLAAVAGNLERLQLEYRRAVRRARALQDVLLPELARTMYESEARLEELEQEDAIWMRQGAAT